MPPPSGLPASGWGPTAGSRSWAGCPTGTAWRPDQSSSSPRLGGAGAPAGGGGGGAEPHSVYRGAGITESAPLTLFQIAWLNVCSSIRSSLVRSCAADCAASGARGPLTSSSGWLGRIAAYGAKFGRLVNEASIGVAYASNWVSGRSPVSSSTVRSIESVL